MGMFDSVVFDCPGCGELILVQSKAGECTLAEIPARSVPLGIAEDISGEVAYCEACGGRWTIIVPGGERKTIPMSLVEWDGE